MKEHVKKVALFLALAYATTLWASQFFEGIWGVREEEQFAFSLFFLIFGSLSITQYMPEEEKFRRWILPLFISGSATLLFLLLSSFDYSYIEGESLFLQFIGGFAAIFLFRLLFNDKKLLKDTLRDEKDKFKLLWFTLIILSTLLLFNQNNISQAADEAYSRGEEAYNRADEAYSHADEAHSEISDIEYRLRY